MHRSMILCKNAGQQIPDDMLQRAVKEFKSCIGAGLVTKVEGKAMLVIQHDMTAPTVAAINTVQKEFKDSRVVFYLGDMPAVVGEDDIQPFRVIGTDDLDHVVVFAAGDFVAFDKPESNHSPAYNCMETALGPYIAKAFNNAAGGDMAKFDTIMNMDMQNTIVGGLNAKNGTICILTSDDKLHTYAKGDLRKVYPWGWSSNHLGYGEGTGTTEVAGTKLNATAGRPRLFGGGPKATVEVKEPVPQVQVPANAPAQDPVKTDTVIPPGPTQTEIEAEDEYAWAACPVTTKNNGDIKEFYRRTALTGVCPNNWKDKPRVRTKYTKKSWAEKEGTIKTLTDPALKTVKTVDPANKPGSEALPVIDVNQTAALHRWLGQGKPKALMDSFDAKKFGAEEIQALEKALPSFEKKAGIALDLCKPVDFGLLVEMGKDVGVETLALFALTFKDMYFLEIETRPAEAAAPSNAVVETAKHVAAKEELKPQRKRLFG